MKINIKNIVSEQYLQQVNGLREQWFSDEDEFLVQTSGSTGKPKTISLKKEHMKKSALATLQFLEIKEGSKALLCLPIDKIGGIMMFVRAAIANLDLTILEPSARPFESLETKESFALSAMVPLQITQSLKDLKRAGKLIAGGGPLSSSLLEELEPLDAQIWHSYGMTETISHIALRQISPKRTPSFKILPEVGISLNEKGCLVINAAQIGVKDLHTKDLAELIDSQHFIWKGRLDNVVLSGGLKLYPEELEQKIELRENFILAGIDDAKLGEKLVLIIEAQETLQETHLAQALDRLGRLEKPKEIFYLSAFVYTSNGKVKRKETLSQAMSL